MVLSVANGFFSLDLQNLNRSVSDDELTLQISVLENNRDDDFNELTVIIYLLLKCRFFNLMN